MAYSPSNNCAKIVVNGQSLLCFLRQCRSTVAVSAEGLSYMDE